MVPSKPGSSIQNSELLSHDTVSTNHISRERHSGRPCPSFATQTRTCPACPRSMKGCNMLQLKRWRASQPVKRRVDVSFEAPDEVHALGREKAKAHMGATLHFFPSFHRPRRFRGRPRWCRSSARRRPLREMLSSASLRFLQPLQPPSRSHSHRRASSSW